VITALLVDDEPPARQRLRQLLADHPDVQVLAEAGGVRAAVSTITRHRPDVVFLDIQLPDDDGFGVVDLLGGGSRPAIVVTTAHADHAVRAFEVGAVDYLLKPFARARLAVALSRVRDHLANGTADPAVRPVPVTRIPVMSGGRVRFVELNRIEIIRADRNYVRIHTGPRALVVRSTLREIEQRLPPGEFSRVSRSAIVRLDRVVEVETLPHGELALRLAGGAQVISGRDHSSTLRALLGIENPALPRDG
jgi:two-component system LytT family response regulator